MSGYKDGSQIIELLHEVRDRVIKIETRMEDLPALREDVKYQGEEIIKMKASVKAIRWVAGVILVTVPASAAAVYRMIKGVG